MEARIRFCCGAFSANRCDFYVFSVFSVPCVGWYITLHEGTGPVTEFILAIAADGERNSILNYEIHTLVPANCLVSSKLVGVEFRKHFVCVRGSRHFGKPGGR